MFFWVLIFIIVTYPFFKKINRNVYIENMLFHDLMGSIANKIINIGTIFSFCSFKKEKDLLQKDIEKSYELTRRWNTVAVITDGTAVLGLGDIGPEAGMPVMEGKCALFKAFGDVDAFPICIRSKDVDEIDMR